MRVPVQFQKRAAVVLLGLVLAGLAGCDDIAEPPQAFCNAFGTGIAPTWTCTNCTVADQSQVLDRDLDSASAVTPTGGATSETFSVRATAAATFAGGATVGIWITVPAAASSIYTLRTLKAGTEVEISTAQNTVVVDARGGTEASGFFGMRTTQEFDAVEFATSGTWDAGETPVYYLYELCSDGGNA